MPAVEERKIPYGSQTNFNSTHNQSGVVIDESLNWSLSQLPPGQHLYPSNTALNNDYKKEPDSLKSPPAVGETPCKGPGRQRTLIDTVIDRGPSVPHLPHDVSSSKVSLTDTPTPAVPGHMASALKQ